MFNGYSANKSKLYSNAFWIHQAGIFQYYHLTHIICLYLVTTGALECTQSDAIFHKTMAKSELEQCYPFLQKWKEYVNADKKYAPDGKNNC